MSDLTPEEQTLIEGIQREVIRGWRRYWRGDSADRRNISEVRRYAWLKDASGQGDDWPVEQWMWSVACAAFCGDHRALLEDDFAAGIRTSLELGPFGFLRHQSPKTRAQWDVALATGRLHGLVQNDDGTYSPVLVEGAPDHSGVSRASILADVLGTDASVWPTRADITARADELIAALHLDELAAGRAVNLVPQQPLLVAYTRAQAIRRREALLRVMPVVLDDMRAARHWQDGHNAELRMYAREALMGTVDDEWSRLADTELDDTVQDGDLLTIPRVALSARRYGARWHNAPDNRPTITVTDGSALRVSWVGDLPEGVAAVHVTVERVERHGVERKGTVEQRLIAPGDIAGVSQSRCAVLVQFESHPEGPVGRKPPRRTTGDIWLAQVN